jgi:hypothetical protein
VTYSNQSVPLGLVTDGEKEVIRQGYLLLLVRSFSSQDTDKRGADPVFLLLLLF